MKGQQVFPQLLKKLPALLDKFHVIWSNNNQNCIHEEVKSTLNSGNARYHSVQTRT